MTRAPPLQPLPPELILQILDFVPTEALTRLEQCSRSWKDFLSTHNARIWSEHIPSTAPFPYLDTPKKDAIHGLQEAADARAGDTFDRTLYKAADWKDYCRRRTLLLRNWDGGQQVEHDTQVLQQAASAAPTQHDQAARRMSGALSASMSFWRGDPSIRRMRESVSAAIGGQNPSYGDKAHNGIPKDCYTAPSHDHSSDKQALYRLPTISQHALTQPEGRLIWRFRPDFHNRFILTTSQHGGLQTLDMDTSAILWTLETAIPFAHLEYSKGYCVFNDDGEGLEIWRLTSSRGVFSRVTVLQHTNSIRGFHLDFPILCVVSTDGRGFIYDLSLPTNQISPLSLNFPIAPNARGHLYQYSDVICYAYETEGYHFHSKTTGAHLGILSPKIIAADLPERQIWHIKHDFPAVRAWPDHYIADGPPETYGEQVERAVDASLTLRKHPLWTSLRAAPLSSSSSTTTTTTADDTPDIIPLEDDEWGAAVLWYNWLVCISRGGRTLLCSDWRGALISSERARETTSVIECAKVGEGYRFDFGGWMSLGHGRVCWEIDDYVYVLRLPTNERSEVSRERSEVTRERSEASGRSGGASFNTDKPRLCENQPIFAIPSVADSQFSNPISFMGMYEDCLMTTYTTLRRSRAVGAAAGGAGVAAGGPRLAHAKTVRVCCFGPEVLRGGEGGLGRGEGGGEGEGSGGGSARDDLGEENVGGYDEELWEEVEEIMGEADEVVDAPS